MRASAVVREGRNRNRTDDRLSPSGRFLVHGRILGRSDRKTLQTLRFSHELRLQQQVATVVSGRFRPRLKIFFGPKNPLFIMVFPPLNRSEPFRACLAA